MTPCLTPVVLEARLHADAPAAQGLDARWRAPAGGAQGPAFGHARIPRPAPPNAKVPYGTPYADHVRTTNFLVTWDGGVATSDQAERTADALETAWSTLVDEQGWAAPVSSDQYLLWVILVNDLPSTGFTTEYVTDEFPDGYPVMYLDVDWAAYPSFWRTLAVHEFHHAVQYAMREGAGEAAESWAWEATAAWASLAVEPDSDGIDYTAAWYAENTSARFDTVDGAHEYGMVTFTTWLESTAPGAILRAWRDGTPAPGSWDARFAEAAGRTPDDTWAAFGDAYAEDSYGRTAMWEDPPVATLVDGIAGAAERLGAAYYRADADAHVTLATTSGGATFDGGNERDVSAGETFAVTATTDGAAWTLSVSAPRAEDALVSDDDTSLEKDVGTCASVPTPRAGGLRVLGAVLAPAGMWLGRRRRAWTSAHDATAVGAAGR